jgi:hypothetical protein
MADGELSMTVTVEIPDAVTLVTEPASGVIAGGHGGSTPVSRGKFDADLAGKSSQSKTGATARGKTGRIETE